MEDQTRPAIVPVKEIRASGAHYTGDAVSVRVLGIDNVTVMLAVPTEEAQALRDSLDVQLAKAEENRRKTREGIEAAQAIRGTE